ncbi:MAG TPA: glycosyltransferase family 39 protein [Candidatus Hydrogenedentes bacterium]|nr:glycosyltransferase family 39 protein [Candidatus Hydrogenedentota bacterium]HPG67005.1 glycosyltransferase family 39 protein [Candidatus Hydrogenedentota bacterium]
MSSPATPESAQPAPGRAWILVVALAAVLFFVNLGGYDLWPADEPRFGEVAREMMQSGDYLAPHCNGQPYKEKPPLLFWAIAAASAPLGDVTEFSARAPSAVAAVLTVFLMYLLAARLYGARTAFWAGIVLATTTRFWWEARSVRTDMILTACLTAALLCFDIWHEKRRAAWLVAFYAAMAGAVYAKGPAGIIFPLLMLFAVTWRRRPDRRQAHWVLGVLAVVVLIALWLIPARMAVSGASGQTAQSDIGAIVYRQMIGRFFLGVSKAQPPWYYLETLPVDLLPWTLFLPWTMIWVWRNRREGRGMRLLLSWILPAFVFFTICSGKRAVYLLPLFPAFAIVIARSLTDLMDGPHALWRRRTGVAWAVALLALGVAPFAILRTAYRDAWSLGLLVFTLAAVAFALYAAYRTWKTDGATLNVTVAWQFAALAVLCALFVLPAVNPYKSAKAFCAPLRALARQGVTYDLFSVGFSREEYVFYAEHLHEPYLIDLDQPAGAAIDPEVWDKVTRGLQGAILDAVAPVEIASFERITPAELEALRQAARQAIEAVDGGPELIATYERAVDGTFLDLVQRFESPVPSFMFVREDTWRSLLTRYEHAPAYTLVGHQQVGHRTVLLWANAAGETLLHDE